MFIQAWRKNQKVERTSPGSKNHFKVTYWDGQEKWTDDYPGDGKPGRREERLKKRKQSRPSIQDAKDTLDRAVKRYVKGDLDKKGLEGAVDDVVVHVGREVARETIRGYLKAHKEGADDKTKEAHGIIRDRQVAKLRKKEAMATRIGKIADRLVANEVTDILAGQIRDSMPELVRAASQATGLKAYKSKVEEDRRHFNTVEFVLGFVDSGMRMGASVRYDPGSDTYHLLPFVESGSRMGRDRTTGHQITDFYAEDFGDVSKMKHIFGETLKMSADGAIPKTAGVDEDYVLQYDNIEEAVGVTGDAGYGWGRTDIWYTKDEYTRDLFMGYKWSDKKGVLPDVGNLRATHVFVGRISETNPNKVYRMMQGEMWSPNGEARTMLRRKGLGHTSMSVGDIIIIGTKVLMVDRHGFVDLAAGKTAAEKDGAKMILGPGEDSRTARIVSRMVQAEYPGQERVFGRMERVEAILGAIKRLPGVADAVINDRTQTADSVEFYVSLKVRERFSKGWPFESRVKEFEVDLNRMRRAVMAALRADRDMGIQGWSMPKRMYRTTTLNYQRDTYFIGYNQDVIAVDLWVR